ncbi:MAG: chromate efflux transporter [Marinilabiliales bacterium]|nr:chromate efflux transporter [Marinilabiliales bacterium]
MEENKVVSLKYLFFTFLKIGAISWGGFMALIAVVQKQLVDKDKVIREEMILDGISMATILPGAVAINVVTYVGYQLRGVRGALISMFAAVFPGFLMIVGLGMIYAKYGELPIFNRFFLGILPAIAAVIIDVAISMAKKQISDYKQVMICLLAAVSLLTIHSFWATLGVIIGSATLGYFLYDSRETEKKETVRSKISLLPGKAARYGWILIALIGLLLFILHMTGWDKAEWVQLNKKLLLTFSGMSVTLFGGGYVIIPAMQQVIVDGFHWLSAREFSDAIAMGQITPGPVILTASFIGYRVAGFMGACVATLAIFLPPGMLMLIFSRFLRSVKDSGVVRSIFKGMRPAIVGMIFSAVYPVAKDAPLTIPTLAIFGIALLLLLKFRVNVLYLIPLAGLAGIVFF